MKKSALMSAIALTSAFGLASCSSTEDDGNINPTFDGQSVKTQFAINIPRAAGNNGTRATADQTQGETNSQFLGINTVYLLPFTTDNVASSTSAEPIELIPILQDEQRKIYRDVNIPIATKKFLFYGLAPQEDENTFATGAFAEDLSFNAETSPANVTFALKTIHSEEIDYTKDAPKALIDVLTAVNNLTWNDMVMKEQFQSMKAGSANSIKQELQKVYDQAFSSTNDYKEAFKNALGTTFSISEDGKIETTLKFPRDLNLPDGIVKINFARRTGFSYVTDYNSVLGDMKIDPSSVTYPAPLAYYANTAIRTNDSGDATFPDANSWNQSNSWTDWTDNAAVTSSTYLIALKENINYAVGNLKLTVKCNQNIADNTNASVTIPSSGFKVTGLLIGGQPDKVGYDFQPTSSYTKTIYDNFEGTPLYARTSDATTANYTLVLPSQPNEKVNFALELENNGDEFVGIDGVVPTGGKFYLIGTLDPTTASSTPSNVENPSIFMTDYQTKVNLTISSLANAYNCIPDIRNTEQQLGLYVDLEWKAGYQFDINIGGN